MILTWSSSGRFTEGELEVIDHLLAGNDDRLAKLRQQVRRPSAVRRQLIAEGRGYRAEMDSTFEDLLINLESDLWSQSFEATDVRTKKLLSFKVRLYRGGLFGFLEGETGDGSAWPKRFKIARVVGNRSYIRFPDLSSRGETLLNWLSERLSTPLDELRLLKLTLMGPTTRDVVQEVERREGIRLPAELVQFLLVTDGLSFGDYKMLGTADLYTIEDRRTKRRLVVAGIVEPDGFVVFPADTQSPVKLLDMSAPDFDTGMFLGNDLMEFLKVAIGQRGSAPQADAVRT